MKSFQSYIFGDIYYFYLINLYMKYAQRMALN